MSCGSARLLVKYQCVGHRSRFAIMNENDKFV